MKPFRLLMILAVLSLSLALVSISLAAAHASQTALSPAHTVHRSGSSQSPAAQPARLENFPAGQPGGAFPVPPDKPSVPTAYKPFYTSLPLKMMELSQAGQIHGTGAALQPLADNGDWDGLGINYPRVLYDGSEYQMWYMGRGMTNPGFGWATGIATSPDGTTWTKAALDNPVVTTGPHDWDNAFLGEASFLYEGSEYKMWYSGSGGGVWQTGYATSSDGIDWEFPLDDPVLPVGSSGAWDEGEADGPVVINDGGVYKMWYHGCVPDYSTCSIGYATSPDGIAWTKYPGNPVLTGTPGAWDEGWAIWPQVIKNGATYEIWYATNSGQIGYATSADGISWAKNADPINLDPWDGGNINGHNVILEGATYKMWFRSGTGPSLGIGYAESTNGVDWTQPVSNPVLHPGNPGIYLEVNYGHDWAWVLSGPYQIVTLTLDTSGGETFTLVGQTDYNGSFGSWDHPDWTPYHPDIQPGDTIIAETASNSTTVDPIGSISGRLDVDNDTVSGELHAPWFAPASLDMRCEVWVEEGFAFSIPPVPADGGSFICDFDSVGWDIQPGQDIAVIYSEPDGDEVVNMFTAPWARVNIDHHWVGINYPAGYNFLVTLTNAAGQVKATAEIESFSGGGWGGDGFEINWDQWTPQGPDIQPGDWVYFQSEDGYNNAVHVGEITGEVDTANDQISGFVNAPWFTTDLNIECHPWGAPGGAPSKNSSAPPDGSAPYTCSWDPSTEWDIIAGQDIAVMYIEPDMDRVIGVFRVPAPHLNVWNWSNSNPAEGGNLPIYVQYRNDGQVPAANTVISVTLDGLTYLSDTAAFPATTGTLPGGQTYIAWDLGSLPADGRNRQFEVFVQVDAAVGEGVSSMVGIATSTEYGEQNWWETHHTWNAQVQPNDTYLNVGKNPWTGDPVAGEDFVWAVNVCNNGSTASSQLILTDTLPVSTTLVGWWGQNGGWYAESQDDQTLVLTRPSIPSGWCGEVYLRFHLDEDAWQGMSISNTASIWSASDLSPDGDWTDSWVQVGSPHSNLSIFKDWQWGRLVPGGEAFYELSIHNSSNIPTEDVQIIVAIPPQATFERAWYNDDAGEHPFDPSQVTPDTLIWDIPVFDNGYYRRFALAFRINDDASPGELLTLAAQITTLPVEDRYDDNAITWTDVINPYGPNLRVLKDGYFRWEGESQLNYELRVMNLGTQRLESVWVTDNYPLDTTLDGWWVNHSPSWVTATEDAPAHQLSFWIEALDPGQTASLGLRLNLDPALINVQGLTFTNLVNASISGDVFPADNSDQAMATTGPDVFIQKELTGGEPKPGEIITFTVQFGNLNQWPWNGNDSYPSHLTETLPAGMTFLYATAPWNPQETWDPLSEDGNTIVWEWGPMWANSAWSFDIAVQLSDDVEGGDVLVNRIEAYGDSPDDVEVNWANNVFELPVTVLAPKFVVSKAYTGVPVAGMPIQYDLTVSNEGTLTGTTLELTDWLPAGLTYGGGGSFAGGAVTWHLPGLMDGETGTAWFTGTLSCSAGTIVTNQEYRITASDQGVLSPNGAPVSLTILEPALSAGFNASALTVLPGEDVLFTSTSTTDGTPLTYTWDFGDDGMAAGPTATHDYTAPGVYTVTLTVTDACGFTDTHTLTITVQVTSYELYLPITQRNP